MATDAAHRVANNPWLSQFPETLRRRVISELIMKSYPPGSAIHLKGDRPDGYYCVVGGHVDIGSIAATGEEIRLTRIHPQQWFGEISVLDGLPRTSDAIAVSSVEVARLPMRAIRELSASTPEFREAMLQNLCRRFRQAFEGIDDLLTLTPRQRLAKWLIDNSAPEGGGAFVNASQDVLSAMVGVSRQSISAYLREWVDAGLVRAGYGQVTVFDLTALAEAAGLEPV